MAELWERIRDEYVNGSESYAQLAERYGVSEASVAYRSRVGKWRELRSARRGNGLPLPLCARDCGIRDSVLRLAGRMAELGMDALSDDRQFNRYIVSARSGKGESASEEVIYGKLDTKAFKELTGAVKDLWSVAQEADGARDDGGVRVELGEAAELAE